MYLLCSRVSCDRMCPENISCQSAATLVTLVTWSHPGQDVTQARMFQHHQHSSLTGWSPSELYNWAHIDLQKRKRSGITRICLRINVGHWIKIIWRFFSFFQIPGTLHELFTCSFSLEWTIRSILVTQKILVDNFLFLHPIFVVFYTFPQQCLSKSDWFLDIPISQEPLQQNSFEGSFVSPQQISPLDIFGNHLQHSPMATCPWDRGCLDTSSLTVWSCPGVYSDPHQMGH